MTKQKKVVKKRVGDINFAEICKQVRFRTNMSEKQMANYLGVTERNYKKYETGEIKPGSEPSFRLAGLYLAFCRINTN